MSPLVCIRAEYWQFPITPRSSSLIIRNLTRHDPVLMKVMPRMGRFILALLVGLGLLGWAASDVVQSTARGWFERDVNSRARLALVSAEQSLVHAWDNPEELRTLLTDLAR